MKNILNPKGHQNRISGSKVTNILLKGWILPIGGVALGRVCACSLRSMLVYIEILNLEGHPNRITGSRVTPILLKGLILPIGGVALGRVCA